MEPPNRIAPTVSDTELMGRIVQQDDSAFEALYDRHSTTVYSLILRIVRDSARAEELAQETFWQVWTRAEQFQGAGAVAAWLNRIARNKALDELRRRKSRPQPSDQGEQRLAEIAAPSSNQVEQQVDRSWNRLTVADALAAIPPEQRSCLEMSYFDGMSQREIAAKLDVPLGTIKTRMRIGLEKLERSLRAAGFRSGEVR